MIKVHCLAYSRAIRLLWLLEDLGQPYDLIPYDRTDQFRAPDALRDVHPLGKSPVIEDGDLKLAESATCLRYITDKFGDETHRPDPHTREFIRHEELLDYVESTFAGACMAVLLPAMQGGDPPDEARRSLQTHLDYVASHLPGTGLLFGARAYMADIQFSYLLANLNALGFLDAAPRVRTYWEDLQKQPGYLAATKAAGPMAPEH
ncbi:glutathione transferase [Loktanella sp. 5RATIMAR09]|uniref:glutathione S-transferase family protein n=1 Tax=Loktanella sp. 5RATIMAR09 TaxID=1225655 RepID=UPI0006EBDD53|nr:glutathione S-transferase [Loktanella sp. 5RATIMAR09]KQI70551.1 glutathione transferase [Loktanella sp. 5RATIMAR09]